MPPMLMAIDYFPWYPAWYLGPENDTINIWKRLISSGACHQQLTCCYISTTRQNKCPGPPGANNAFSCHIRDTHMHVSPAWFNCLLIPLPEQLSLAPGTCRCRVWLSARIRHWPCADSDAGQLSCMLWRWRLCFDLGGWRSGYLALRWCCSAPGTVLKPSVSPFHRPTWGPSSLLRSRWPSWWAPLMRPWQRWPEWRRPCRSTMSYWEAWSSRWTTSTRRTPCSITSSLTRRSWWMRSSSSRYVDLQSLLNLFQKLSVNRKPWKLFAKATEPLWPRNEELCLDNIRTDTQLGWAMSRLVAITMHSALIVAQCCRGTPKGLFHGQGEPQSV